MEKNQDLVDALRRVAEAAGRSVAQVVMNWTIHQPGVTRGIVRGETARSDSRQRRGDGLAVDRGAIGPDRYRPWLPAAKPITRPPV